MHPGIKISVLTIIIVGLLIYMMQWDSTNQGDDEPVENLLFYCAAGIKPPVEEIVREYKKNYGTSVQIQYGGSGTLLSNIRVAQKGDLFLAADQTYIDTAKQEYDLLDEVIPIAAIRPVIAVAKGNPKNIHSLQDLLRTDVAVAVANPEAASIGRVTKDLLEKTGRWAPLAEAAKVTKPTVTDIANDIKLGTVDAGFLWDATVNQYPELEMVDVPEFAEGRQQITLSVLKSTKHPAKTLHFARYLTARDRGLPYFQKYGYVPVEGDRWEEKPRLLLYSGGVNQLAIEKTIEEFEKREGVEVTRVYNGCGILVSQMRAFQMKGEESKMPDAYFACDVSFMDQVDDDFMERIDLAETDMVILVPKGNPKNILTLQDLARPGLQIGLANPEQSALGALCKRMLEQVGIYDEVVKNVAVNTPTADLLVNQISVGKLDAVIVYQANCPNVKDTLTLVAIDHPAAKAIQPFATYRNSRHKHLVERFLVKLQSAPSQQKFIDTGFRWRGGSQAG